MSAVGATPPRYSALHRGGQGTVGTAPRSPNRSIVRCDARRVVRYLYSTTFGALAIQTMAETSPKQLVLKAIEDLPADASIEDAMERLYFLAKVYRGLADADAGRFVSHEDVKARFGLR